MVDEDFWRKVYQYWWFVFGVGELRHLYGGFVRLCGLGSIIVCHSITVWFIRFKKFEDGLDTFPLSVGDGLLGSIFESYRNGGFTLVAVRRLSRVRPKSMRQCFSEICWEILLPLGVWALI